MSEVSLDFAGFFHRLNRSLVEYNHLKARYDLEHAPLFSGFDALFPNERALSRMLRYFLDEHAGHGQQRTFLWQFLRLVGCPKQEFRESRAHVEHPTQNGRFIDILLELDNYRIGIEDKPWALEGDDQCKDYAEELDRLSRGKADEWMLVFLTPDGRKPTTAGLWQKRVVPLRYDALAEALTTDCVRLQPFLKDFHRFVRQWINGEEAEIHPKEKAMVEEFLRPENLDVTLEIVAQSGALRQKLMARFQQEVLAKIHQQFGPSWKAVLMHWKGKPVADFEKVDSGLYFFKPEWKERFCIGFSNAKENGSDMIFGVYYWGRDPSVQQIASGGLKRKLDEAFDVLGKNSPYWDWWIPLKDLGQPENKDWYRPSVMKKMAQDGGREMVDDIYTLVETAIKIAAPFIDAELTEPT